MAAANQPVNNRFALLTAILDVSTIRIGFGIAIVVVGLLVALALPLPIVFVATAVLAGIALLSRNARLQRFAFQASFTAATVLVARVLVSNLTTELDQINLEVMPFIDVNGSFPFIDLHLDFLEQRAGFGISETSFGREYTENRSYGEAYLTGLLNTLRVAILGIALASAVGLIVGLARLSGNWLLSKLATVYVETFRNVPLLVQLIFWYTAVILKLPKIQEDASFLNIVLISNRSIALPWVNAQNGFGLWFLLLLVAAAGSFAVWYLRNRSQNTTGKPSYPGWSAVGVFIVLGAATFLLTGSPMTFDQPELVGRSHQGGLQLTPEFTALLLGLTLYTGAFIAEVVRGSVQAIPKGQTEAASAVGLNGYQRLRLVILPQAMTIMIPPLTNQYLNLVKNSSLGIAVAFPDLFRVTRITISQTGQAVPMIILVMVTYLSLSLFISFVMNVFNSRLSIQTR